MGVNRIGKERGTLGAVDKKSGAATVKHKIEIEKPGAYLFYVFPSRRVDMDMALYREGKVQDKDQRNISYANILYEATAAGEIELAVAGFGEDAEGTEYALKTFYWPLDFAVLKEKRLVEKVREDLKLAGEPTTRDVKTGQSIGPVDPRFDVNATVYDVELEKPGWYIFFVDSVEGKDLDMALVVEGTPTTVDKSGKPDAVIGRRIKSTKQSWLLVIFSETEGAPFTLKQFFWAAEAKES